jgi:ribosomal protein L40E
VRGGGYVPMRFEEMMKSKFLSLCVHCWHRNPMRTCP